MPAKKRSKTKPVRKPGRPTKPLPPKGYSATLDQLIQKFHCSRATLVKVLKEFGIQRNAKGFYKDSEVSKALQASKQKAKAGIVKSPETKEAYNDYWRAKAEEKVLDLQIKKGLLIDNETVFQELVERETIFKNRLLGLPSLLAPKLVGLGPSEIQAICTEHFVGLLRELERQGSEAYNKANVS